MSEEKSTLELVREIRDELDARNPLIGSGFALYSDGVHKERRERIATAVLAGMLTNSKWFGSVEEFAQNALSYTDALIAELDK